MTEPVISYLRWRVVNPRNPTIWSENFENPTANVSTLWHSLGTEAGTDNSINYWTNANGAAWSFASHLASSPASGADNILIGGHPDWNNQNGGIIFECRLNVSVAGAGIVGFAQSNGDGYLWQDAGANIFNLNKRVSGVYTQIGTNQSFTFTQGNAVWLKMAIGASGSITCYVALDSAGAPGTYTAFSFSDSTYTSGKVGLRDGTGVAHGFGGAFANVCTLKANGPNFWTPVVTTGEPAFALSAVSPQQGLFSASIYLGNSAGNGAWQQATTLPATQSTTQTLLQGQIKASAGTANVSGGGLTTTNGGVAFGNQTVTGQMAANPTLSCNYSGAVGTAYFDSLSIVSQGVEITNDLPTLHTTHIEVVAFQPGNPGSTALGSFTIPLHPPGSEGYAAAKPIYDQLDYFQRVEGYISHDGASLGKLYYAGLVTGIRKGYGTNSRFELTGHSDTLLLNLSRPLPGETLSLSYTSGSSIDADYRQAHNYFGTNEPGWTDNFANFVAGNYTATNLPTFAAGAWSSTTDDGLNVVTTSTGTGAVLIAKTGVAPNDIRHTQMVEVSGRLQPSADATNAGKFGVGISTSNANANNCVVVYVTAKKNAGTGRWDLDVHADPYNAGVLGAAISVSSALASVDDAEGFIPVTISYLNINATGSAVVVNGKLVMGSTVVVPQIDPNTGAGSTYFPFLFFGTPATGAAAAFQTNLVQMVRYSDDLNSGTAAFKPGTIGSPAHSLNTFADTTPTFLELISRAATREGWYWRYTPQAYVVGTRTLGILDFTADPGTDRGTNKSVVFNRADGTLVNLELTANGDQFVAGTTAAGPPGTDGGGLAYWRDIGTMTKYGVIEDQVLSVTAPNYQELRKGALNVQNNRLNLSSTGSKTAIVLRDPQTADVWRELDKVMIHDPEIGINYLVARVLAYTFDEGQPTQNLTLDQFSSDDPTLLSRRLQTGVFQTVAKFNTR